MKQLMMGAHSMLPRDYRRQETCSNISVHTLVDLNLSCFVKTSEDWRHLDYVHLDIQVYRVKEFKATCV